MTEILKGKPVAQALNDKIKDEVASLKAKGITPSIGIVRVGDRTDDIAYENNIKKNCEYTGINCSIFQVDPDTSLEKYSALIKQLNADKSIYGILPFRPLPKHLNEEVLKNIIDPKKDIDCVNPVNLQKVFCGEMDSFTPCTASAVMEILKYYNVPLNGANVVVIGRSLVVGKPLSMMLLKENATVTICHSRTKNIPDYTLRADIVITAIGKTRFVDETYLSKKSIVIDVGINDDKNGKICGDVDYDAVRDKVKSITPVPGGVGSITTSILLKHIIIACKYQLL
jgi:methylenetetrahydrofolate dehydrogenase (NADP+)/methenyltetrahydrofolate cyclohydrolase